MSEPRVIKWVLDTRPLWPGAKTTRDLAKEASRVLGLLAPDEQAAILRYHFVKDAKMALASALLKRHAITSSCSVPWSSANFTRDAHTKPVFLLPDGSQPLIFNLSHQAGLVSLVAVYRAPDHVSVGVDIVCPSERRDRDHAAVAKEGWRRYVDMHDSVFSPGEAQRLVHLPSEELDMKLLYFYTLWCLREAYVKMTGEALLANWLTELDLRYYAPPGEEPPERRALEIWFKGRKVEDVHVQINWLLHDYMICTAVRGNTEGTLDFGQPWALLNIEEVVDNAVNAKQR